jgi:hypothetical protein
MTGGILPTSSELLAQFHISQDAPLAGDMDQIMGAGKSTPEQTSRLVVGPNKSPPRRNLDPKLVGDQQEASLAGLAD